MAAAAKPTARKHSKGSAKSTKSAPPTDVRVLWRELPAIPFEREEQWRQIAGTVIGHIQRAGDAPVVLTAGLASTQAAKLKPVQTGEALSYVEGKRIASIQLADNGTVNALTDDGELIELKTSVRKSGPGTVAAMDEPLRPLRIRRPMAVYRRPGKGGLQRSRGDDFIDPTEGIDEFGVVTWWSVEDGAAVGLLELDPTGTAVIICRLSSEEKNDRLVDQLRPCLALAKQHGLKIRMVIFAVKMSGTREVRADRAGPAPKGEFEREDMLELDKYLQAGWVEHILARGGDRIARDILPGETLLVRWAKHGVALWLSDLGRRVNYTTDSGDRMLVRTMMMISAEERNALVLRLQRASLNKGPLGGNGHLGPTRFGVLRDKKTRRQYEDEEQWWWILRAFELADSGTCLEDEALSTRAVTAHLAAEGCTFDHDRVRTILKDKFYATGEYTSLVRGVPVAQTPVQLKKPVPIDQYTRVQNLLALRQGKTTKTPLGEFLFNYVSVYHDQCKEEHGKRGPSLVKGYIIHRQNEHARTYRHAYWVPDCCRKGGRGARGSFTWDRDLLERPVVEAIRDLARHPELLRQLQVAARHTVADSSARLTDPQRTKLEHEIIELRQRQDAAIDAWIDRATEGSHDLAGYSALMNKFEGKINTLERRLEMDAKARDAQSTQANPHHKQHVDAFLEILTIDTPTDPAMRALRARLFQQIVSSVVIDDSGEGPITITLEGHLVPDGAPLDAGNPVLASEELLDAYIAKKSGKEPAAERLVREVNLVQTDLSGSADKAVSINDATAGDFLGLPSTADLQRAIRQTLESESWRQRVADVQRTGVPSWRLTLKITTSETT